MKVAIVYRDPDDVVINPTDRHKIPYFTEHYLELPLRVGRFNPILSRKSSVKADQLGATWLYLPEPSEPPEPSEKRVMDSLLPVGFGDYLPDPSFILMHAPEWVRVGLLYVRTLYQPLFELHSEACEGFAAMSESHPKSFAAWATTPERSTRAREHLLLASLLSKWAEMKESGTLITMSRKIEEFARAIGQDASTVKAMEKIKKRIARASKG